MGIFCSHLQSFHVDSRMSRASARFRITFSIDGVLLLEMDTTRYYGIIVLVY